MKSSLTIGMLLVFLLPTELLAQQNRFQCFNKKAVELDMKSSRFNHFFVLELNKKEDRDPDMSKYYREQALYFGRKYDEEREKCLAYPQCAKEYQTPTFNSQQACENYLAPIELQLKAVEKQIRTQGQIVQQLLNTHHYTDAIKQIKIENLLYADKACLKKQIEACNCMYYQTPEEINDEYIRWEIFGIGDYVHLEIGKTQIRVGNEQIPLAAYKDLEISGFLKNYADYVALDVSYSFSYVLNGETTSIVSNIPTSGKFKASVPAIALKPGKNVLFVSLVNESEYKQVLNLILGPFIINVEEATSQQQDNFDMQGNGWAIKKYQMPDPEFITSINQIIEKEYIPVGITCSGNTKQILFLQQNSLNITHWNIENYQNAASLQRGISDYMNQSYFPMGISFEQNAGFDVLYVLSDLQGDAWQIIESDLDLNTIRNDVQPYIEQNYIPVGISVFANRYYTLMVRVAESQLNNWIIDGLNTTNTTQNINQKAAQGLAPFGYLTEDNVTNILYVGF